MGRTDLRRNQSEFEASLEGLGRPLAERMHRARAYQRKVQHHVVWTDPILSKVLEQRHWDPPAGDPALLARLRADPDLRMRPHWAGAGRQPSRRLPPLDPLGPRAGHPMAVYHTCPGGGLALSLGELSSLGRIFFEEDWIRRLFTWPPLEKAHGLGLSADSRRNTVEQFIRWLDENIRSGWPDYAAACFDMYCAGVAVRMGILPGNLEFPNAQTLLEEAERERARAQTWQRAHIREERERFLKESGQDLRLLVAPSKGLDPALRKQLQDFVPTTGSPELSDASRPKKMTLGEREIHEIRSAMVRLIRGATVIENTNDFSEQVGKAYSDIHMNGVPRPGVRHRIPPRAAR